MEIPEKCGTPAQGNIKTREHLMVLKNVETWDERVKRNMPYGERDCRNALLDLTPFMWEEVKQNV